MATIDATARVADAARIGDGVEVGPYCLVGPDVELKDGVRLIAHVNVTGATTIGEATVAYPFVSLGTPPQSVHYHGEPNKLVIGARCELREKVTMNIGTVAGGGVTRVGDRCIFMAASHVGHDCEVSDDVILAEHVALGGHASVGSSTFFGANSAVHQFVRVGEGVMVHGVSGVAARNALAERRHLNIWPFCGRYTDLTRVLNFLYCRSKTDSAKSEGGRDAADCRLARNVRHGPSTRTALPRTRSAKRRDRN